MAVNQLEATLQAVTNTIVKLEKDGKNGPKNEKALKELRKERNRLLDELNLN